MLTTLASAFMTATRMDGFTHAGPASAAAAPGHRPASRRALAWLGLRAG